jgi:crotonobetainyl-CoA:carnitine CoA-transferase CaiB-like acyl-CoA transferase
MTDAIPQVLDGVRVLDFGRYIAGPFCAALLGDFGADVIRIEKVDGGEDRWTVPVTPGGDGAGFLQWARGKRSVTLDPMKPQGREIVRALVATADVVVANLPPATLKAMGLDYATLAAVKPDIVLTTVSAFGGPGPYAERVGFDGVAQALSGNMHLTGQPDEPMKNYSPFVDYGTAAFAALGTLAALMHRSATGRGQHVEGSLLGTALTIMNATLIEQALLDKNRVATGNRGQTAAPSDVFRTKDGWILVSVVGDPLFRRWVKLVDEPAWLEDPRFATDETRGEHGTVVSERMQRWCAERTTRDAVAALEDARIPCGEVLAPAQTLVDPHVLAASFLTSLSFPGLERLAPIAAPPVKLSRSPARIHGRAPSLGEHTDEVLAEIGYTTAQIATLRRDGVV